MLPSAENPSNPCMSVKSARPAITLPRSCAPTYNGTRPQASRPPIAAPTETAGLKCPPEIRPTAYAITRTVRPKASPVAT